jgi:hypothetical protein
LAEYDSQLKSWCTRLPVFSQVRREIPPFLRRELRDKDIIDPLPCCRFLLEKPGSMEFIPGSCKRRVERAGEHSARKQGLKRVVTEVAGHLSQSDHFEQF